MKTLPTSGKQRMMWRDLHEIGQITALPPTPFSPIICSFKPLTLFGSSPKERPYNSNTSLSGDWSENEDGDNFKKFAFNQRLPSRSCLKRRGWEVNWRKYFQLGGGFVPGNWNSELRIEIVLGFPQKIVNFSCKHRLQTGGLGKWWIGPSQVLGYNLA